MATKIGDLAGLLIPLHNKTLLLPNISLAELIPFRKPVPVAKTPAWHLGTLAWRGISIPVISFEALNGEMAVENIESARLAVFNGAGASEKLSFFAVVTQGIPRPTKLSATEIVKEKKKVGPAEAMAIIMEGSEAIIPNVDFIESAILKAKIV